MTEWECWTCSHICLNTVQSGDLMQSSSLLIVLAPAFQLCSWSHLFLVSSLFNTRAVSCFQLRFCLSAQTAQALSQILVHYSRVSLFNLCFDLKQCLMINYSTISGMGYIKREQRILYSRIIRLVTFNQFIYKIFALLFDNSGRLNIENRGLTIPRSLGPCSLVENGWKSVTEKFYISFCRTAGCYDAYE